MLSWIELIINSNSINELIRALFDYLVNYMIDVTLGWLRVLHLVSFLTIPVQGLSPVGYQTGSVRVDHGVTRKTFSCWQLGTGKHYTPWSLPKDQSRGVPAFCLGFFVGTPSHLAHTVECEFEDRSLDSATEKLCQNSQERSDNLQIIMELLDIVTYALLSLWHAIQHIQWQVYLSPRHHHVWGKPISRVKCAAVSCSQKRQVHIPLFVVSVQKAMDHFGQCLVEPFHKTIRRWMIWDSLTFIHLKKSTYLLEEIRHKSSSLGQCGFQGDNQIWPQIGAPEHEPQSPLSDPLRKMLPSIWWNNHQTPECTCFASQRVAMVEVCPHPSDPWG